MGQARQLFASGPNKPDSQQPMEEMPQEAAALWSSICKSSSAISLLPPLPRLDLNPELRELSFEEDDPLTIETDDDLRELRFVEDDPSRFETDDDLRELRFVEDDPLRFETDDDLRELSDRLKTLDRNAYFCDLGKVE